MAHYESDEVVTFYFVILDDGTNEPQIQGYSDNKEYVKAYMEFHNCKHYKLKSMTKPYGEIVKILNENVHDEIHLANVLVKNPNGKKGKRSKFVVVPMTMQERLLVETESDTFMSSRIAYHHANDLVCYLKKKYQKALRNIFFIDVMNKVVHNLPNKVIDDTEVDQLITLYRSLPDHFGE